MNTKHSHEISEEEIRIVGLEPERRGRGWLKAALAVIALATAIAIVWFTRGGEPAGVEELSSDRASMSGEGVEYAVFLPQGVLSDSACMQPADSNSIAQNRAYCHIRDTVVNDVPLRILTPIDAVPELSVGRLDTSRMVLAAMAADIRKDNGEIVGAFVLRGNLLSRGNSKRGFCALADSSLVLGMAETTAWLERAVETGGYFFRQYSMVHEGEMVGNKPKGKYVRRALCLHRGISFVVESLSEESLHDFAQALADLPVSEAVSLVGGMADGWAVGEEGQVIHWGGTMGAQNTNYIVWRRRAVEP